MKPMESLIGYVMRTGLWISVIIVLIGGVLYLLQNGSQFIHYQTLQHDTKSSVTLLDILRGSFSFSPVSLVWLGLLILVLTQVIRVALTVVLFIVERDFIFACISGLILIILIYSIFWRS